MVFIVITFTNISKIISGSDFEDEIIWINIIGLHNNEIIELVGRSLNIHQMDLEDIAKTLDIDLTDESFWQSSIDIIKEDIDIEINPDDIRIDTYRSSGAGGQHINKTSSAIRITHMPTGIVVTCQNERSQFQNKDKAMQMLKAKLYMLKLQEQADKLSDIRGEVTEIGWGNQIRSYVMQPYTMVKDHRTNAETGNVDAVMDGGIDLFINAYLKWIALGTGAKEEEA